MLGRIDVHPLLSRIVSHSILFPFVYASVPLAFKMVRGRVQFRGCVMQAYLPCFFDVDFALPQANTSRGSVLVFGLIIAYRIIEAWVDVELTLIIDNSRFIRWVLSSASIIAGC